MRVDYLPTNVMLADYFTKPLMGKRFMDLREYVMGWKIIHDLMQGSMNKERVGKQDGEG